MNDAEYPKAVLVRGVPGGGKSQLTDILRQKLGARVEVLDPDAVDQDSGEYRAFVETQTREGVDPKLHLYRWSRARAYAAIEAHKIIIWNQAFTNLEIFRKMIDRLETHAAACGTKLPILVVEVEVDPQTARQRVAERVNRGGHTVSEEAFARIFNDYKSFVDEGLTVVKVDGRADINSSVTTVLDAIQTM